MKDPHRGAEHAIIRKRNSENPDDATQPLSITKFTESVGNAFGATIEKEGLIATFPIEAFREGNQFFLIYEKAFGTKSTFGFDIKEGMLKEGRADLQGEQRSQEAGAAPAQSRAKAQPLEVPATVPPGMNWIADENTRQYYSVDCAAALRVPPARRFYFQTEEAAQEAGYRSATEC